MFCFIILKFNKKFVNDSIGKSIYIINELNNNKFPIDKFLLKKKLTPIYIISICSKTFKKVIVVLFQFVVFKMLKFNSFSAFNKSFILLMLKV
jgi:hypothetical protein